MSTGIVYELANFKISEPRQDCVCSDSDDMPQEAIDQIDHIDNTTHNYIQELVDGAHREGLIDVHGDVEWNMEHIGEINDMVIEYLRSVGFNIWHPYAGSKDEQ